MGRLLLLCLILLQISNPHALFVASKSLPNSPSDHHQLLSHKEECLALLEFRGSFDFSDYNVRKVLGPWKLERQGETAGGSCCEWDGIECDAMNEHVIGLDLSETGIQGSIDSNSTLFRLVHLQKLNLAINRFFSSRIPSVIGNLSSLTTLNLSFSGFTGQVPSEIFLGMTNLSSLDLSSDHDGLELRGPNNLDKLVRSLTKLQHLHLAYVNISSSVPVQLANLSSLKSLVLSGCGLKGEFPAAIFHLPNLKIIDVSHNSELSGHLPEFHSGSLPLETLSLSGTNFSGELPVTLGNLGSLTALDMGECKFMGVIPCSISNLTSITKLDLSGNQFHGPITSLANLNLLRSLHLSGNKFQGPIHSLASTTHLIDLDLSYNQFNGPIPRELGNLIQLAQLDLSYNQFTGPIPSEIGNLIHLPNLRLSNNQLTGPIPSELGNLTQLKELYLHSNQLTGPIPSQLANMTQLTDLDLSHNLLRGPLPFDVFLELESLSSLSLSFNNLTMIARPGMTNSSGIQTLGLNSCNLQEFPEVLQSLEQLERLDLSNNSIHGKIPGWFLNVSPESLIYLNLSRNHLTGFARTPVFFKWSILETLDLSFNELQGSLPIPPKQICAYLVGNNELSGEISPLICNCSRIIVLDLSKNNLTGEIPECFRDLTNGLAVLNLRNNGIHGRIPRLFEKECSLQVLDLGNNTLEGKLSRSILFCTKLQFLNLGGNMLKGTFLPGLGSFLDLRVLILRSNSFYGAIEEPRDDTGFPSLQIIDLSQNNFNGSLPSKYFQSWKAMRVSSVDNTYHVGGYSEIELELQYYDAYEFSMTIINKGIRTEYSKIMNNFAMIDLSSNRFSGEILDSVASLKGLHLLNLSNNLLSGHIPSSLGTLTNLEALDLSCNQLSGEIPQQLTQLFALEFLNVSKNRLSGRIPRGTQVDTFGNSSFEGNEGLCGDLWEKKCGDSGARTQPPPLQKNQDDEGNNLGVGILDWKAVVVGYASTFIIGAVIGHLLMKRRPNWLVRTFGVGGWRQRRCRRQVLLQPRRS